MCGSGYIGYVLPVQVSCQPKISLKKQSIKNNLETIFVTFENFINMLKMTCVIKKKNQYFQVITSHLHLRGDIFPNLQYPSPPAHSLCLSLCPLSLPTLSFFLFSSSLSTSHFSGLTLLQLVNNRGIFRLHELLIAQDFNFQGNQVSRAQCPSSHKGRPQAGLSFSSGNHSR